MDKRPMAKESRHVAADNPHCQSSCEHRQHQFRPEMDKPEQTDMQCCHQASSLIRPVAASEDVEYDEGTAGGDGQMVPVCKPWIGNCPEKSAKQDACRADVTAAQNHIYYLVPTRALLSFTSVVVISFHALRQTCHSDITLLHTMPGLPAG